MTDEQKARLEELRAKEEGSLTDEEKTELDELVALETPPAPADDAGSGDESGK